MDRQYYAEFLQKIGHRVRESSRLHWFNVADRVYAPFPFEETLDPLSTEDLAAVLGQDGLIARYGCLPTDGVQSYRLTIRDTNYGFNSLSSKSRNQTRRGLEQCVCGPIDLQELFSDGIELNRLTLQRQQRRVPANFESYWRNYYLAAADCRCARAWGAWHEGRLASYLISFRLGTIDNICIVRSDAARLKFYPNNAMLFTYVQHVLSQKEVTEVSIGLQSLLAGMEPLDHFKLGLGFQKQPFGQRIEFRSPWGNLVPRSLASLASRALGPWADHEKIGRLSGLLSWYALQPRTNKAA